MKPFLIYHVKPYERPELEAASRALGVPVTLRPEGLKAALPQPGEAEAICLFVQDPVDAELLKKLSEVGVRLIVLRSRGFDHVDLEAAKKLGLQVLNTTYPQTPIVEHTLAMILALNRRLKRANQQLNQGDFTLDHLLGEDLEGRVAGVVGTGLIGFKVAQALMAFGMKIQAYDPYPNEALKKLNVPYLPDLESLFKSSEVVSLHCPADPSQSRPLVHRGLLELLPKGAIVVNTARGSLLETQAAFEAVQSGALAGLGLDVYDHEQAYFYEQGVDLHKEPLLESMLRHPNIIVTPHQAFLSRRSLRALLEQALRHYQAWSTGKLTSSTP